MTPKIKPIIQMPKNNLTNNHIPDAIKVII